MEVERSEKGRKGPSQAVTCFSQIGRAESCGCGAHRQHVVFRFYWSNPSASRGAAAHALKVKAGNVREALRLLRRRDLSRVCPECFRPSLEGGACRNCGFEPSEPVLPVELTPGSRYPTSQLHPGNMLGSSTDFAALEKSYGFSNRGFVIERKINRQIGTPLLDAVRSDVANSLCGGVTPEIAQEAGVLCVKEWREFVARYPLMSTSTLARRQLKENVLARLRMLHPTLSVTSSRPESSGE